MSCGDEVNPPSNGRVTRLGGSATIASLVLRCSPKTCSINTPKLLQDRGVGSANGVGGESAYTPESITPLGSPKNPPRNRFWAAR
jgi:hypothetical protein